MGMQNYAKFESRVAEDSIETMNSIGSNSLMGVSPSSYGGYSYSSGFFNFIGDLIQLVSIIFGVGMFIFGGFFFLYVIISLFTKGGEKTISEIKALGIYIIGFLGKILSYIKNIIKKIFNFLWSKKLISVLLILVWILYSFGTSVVNGNSRFLRLTKIQSGYVGVDLENNKILNPGYHLYSPVKTNYFLSPTNNFDFEIVEVTVNSKEELGVVLDYRVGFKLEDNKRLDFYKKYGAKNIRLVSSDIVMPRLLEVIKGIIRNYSFKDISSSHKEIKAITLKEANEVLKPIGIELQDINILDIRLPQTYLKSKEDLLNAENELKLAEARLGAQKKESEKKVLEAENAKKVKIIGAEAIAEYNKIINSEKISEQVLETKRLELEKDKIKKWDGKLPSSVSGDFDF